MRRRSSPSSTSSLPRRCLAPGGTAVVGSWQPMEANVPFCARIFAALREHIPNLPFGSQDAPLSHPDTCKSEMSAAGFQSVVTHDVRKTFEYPSLAEGWA